MPHKGEIELQLYRRCQVFRGRICKKYEKSKRRHELMKLELERPTLCVHQIEQGLSEINFENLSVSKDYPVLDYDHILWVSKHLYALSLLGYWVSRIRTLGSWSSLGSLSYRQANFKCTAALTGSSLLCAGGCKNTEGQSARDWTHLPQILAMESAMI